MCVLSHHVDISPLAAFVPLHVWDSTFQQQAGGTAQSPGCCCTCCNPGRSCLMMESTADTSTARNKLG